MAIHFLLPSSSGKPIDNCYCRRFATQRGGECGGARTVLHAAFEMDSGMCTLPLASIPGGSHPAGGGPFGSVWGDPQAALSPLLILSFCSPSLSTCPCLCNLICLHQCRFHPGDYFESVSAIMLEQFRMGISGHRNNINNLDYATCK